MEIGFLEDEDMAVIMLLVLLEEKLNRIWVCGCSG